MANIGGFTNSNNASLALTLLGGSTTTSAPTSSALAGFTPYLVNEPQKLSDYTKQSSYQKALTYFQAHISKVKTVDALVHDPQLLNFILSAFNLQADAQYPAKVAAILNSNMSDKTSYANSLLDPRYQQLANAFNVHANGMTSFSNSTVVNAVISKYTTNTYEANLDNVNPALRSAAYFLRTVGSITDAYNILGDSVLRNVVITALGLPAQIANLPVADQRQLINSKIDVKKLETSGASSSSNSSSATSAALTTANSDASAILADRNIVGAAETSVQTVDERIVALQKSYSTLAAIQNPGGPTAAEIPVQQAAAPVLVQQQGLLNAAQSATSTVTSTLSQLQQLIQKVGTPGNTTPLSDLKTQFQTLHDQIKNAIAGATYQFDNGTGGATYTTQNLLDGSLGGPISVQYDAKGDTVTISPRDLGSSSAFQTQLDAANTAFQNLSGISDGATINAASTALNGAQAAGSFVIQSVANDAANFTKAIASVKTWAGTYNTAQLYRGSQSLVDAGSRLTQVNQLVTQIQQVADNSSKLPPTADRTTLQSQYSDLITKLGTAINAPSQSNLDNLLASNPNAATPGYYGYSIDTGGTYDIQARAHDLTGSVLSPLSGGDVASAADANSVIAMLTGSVQTALTTTGQQIGLDNQNFSLAANTIDPRAAVDGQYRKLVTDMPTLVKNAAWNGSNVLDPKQAAITLNVGTANMSITITPDPTYGADVTQTLSNGSQSLPSDAADTSGALAQLETARFNNARVLSTIRQQINQLDLAKNITATKITSLTKQQSSTASLTPINSTPYAKQLVQKYLAAVDAQNSSTSGSASYALQLFQPTQTLDQTIAQSLIAKTHA